MARIILISEAVARRRAAEEADKAAISACNAAFGWSRLRSRPVAIEIGRALIAEGYRAGNAIPGLAYMLYGVSVEMSLAPVAAIARRMRELRGIATEADTKVLAAARGLIRAALGHSAGLVGGEGEQDEAGMAMSLLRHAVDILNREARQDAGED
jgi:hypothetical protein